MNDAASPDSPPDLLGDTPGPLGCNDYADPDSYDSPLGVGRLHLTLSWDKDLRLWDYDPGRLLNDPNLSPGFVEAAHRILAKAVRKGLRPQVHEAYRTPEESDRKYRLWKQKKGGRAAPAWRSCHNYGLAMDVWLYDRKGKYIDNHVKGWYRLYKLLAEAADGFVWGANFGDGDADHFEFHPKWPSGANGDFLLRVKAWAQQAAVSMPGAGVLPDHRVGAVPEPRVTTWMPFFWWAAGVGGPPPTAAFLAKNPPPQQPPPAKPKKSK
jgi:hypothetical protein